MFTFAGEAIGYVCYEDTTSPIENTTNEEAVMESDEAEAAPTPKEARNLNRWRQVQ